LRALEDRITPSTYTVINTGDAGAGNGNSGDLRYCITQANATPGLDTIVFDPATFGAPQIISLLTGLPQITESIKITGPGSGLLTLQPAPSATTTFSLIRASATNNLSLDVSGLTLTNSNAAGIGLGSSETVTLTDVACVRGGSSTFGGIYAGTNCSVTGQSCVVANNSGYGIYLGQGGSLSLIDCVISGNRLGGIRSYQGSLVLDDCAISGNSATAYGGGIDAFSVNSFILSNSAVSGNYSAGFGGGIYLGENPSAPANALTIRNCTIAGNTAVGAGGGIEWSLAIGTLAIQNSTIVGNTVSPSGTTQGGGGGIEGSVFNSTATTLLLQSTVVAANVDLFMPHPCPDIFLSTNGTTFAVTADHALIGIADGVPFSSSTASTLTGTFAIPLDPKLALLTNNGGLTLTAAPLRGSPLIDAGSNPANLATDQRGKPRVAGPTPDIGAVERTPGMPDAVAGPMPAVTSAGGSSYQFTVTYSDDAAIDASTLDGSDLFVSGPNAYGQLAILVGVTPPGNGSPLTATYSITPPGGSWQLSADGVYTLTLLNNQVLDTNVFAVAGGQLGTFAVAVPMSVTVTSLADSGPGTLRQAILDTNAVPAANDIQFDPSLFAGGPVSINLTAALPTVTDSVTIAGPGSNLLTVRNTASSGYMLYAFYFAGLPGAAVNLSGFTVAGCKARGLNFAGDTAILTDMAVTGNAGGIYAYDGSLTIRNSSVTGNSLPPTTNDVYGGGIFAVSNGLLIDGCTISGNTSPNIGSNDCGGGGLCVQGYIFAGGTTIRNSTIANNVAQTGGGIHCVEYPGTVLIQNSTIAGNTSTWTGTGNGGGGIAEPALTKAFVNLQSSLVAKNVNSKTAKPADIWGNNFTSTPPPGIVLADHSLIGVGDDGVTFAPGSTLNLTGTMAAPLDPKLGPLHNNGGPTSTMALLANSPALNVGSNPSNVAVDQRGVARTIGPAPDIGAYEYQPITVAGVQVNDGSAQRSEVRSIAVTFSGPVSFAGGNANAKAAFELVHVQTGNNVDLAATVSTNALGQTVVTLTFSGNETDPVSSQNGAAASLADGRYQLTVLGSAVTDTAFGWALDGDADGVPTGNYVSPADAYQGNGLHLYRLFADVNGDGVVDPTDLNAFRLAFNTNNQNPGSGYLAYLDANNDGAIDPTDLNQFRIRFNANVF
jgi:hypothetical protein